MSALDRTITGTLAAFAPALDRAAEQLPPPISVTINTRGISINVYLAGAPLQGLLAWTEQLTGVEFHVARHGELKTTQVTASGLLDGAFRVELLAYTPRQIGDPDTRSGYVTEAEIRRVAADETPWFVGATG